MEELSGFQGSRAPAAADASRLRRGHAKAGPNTPCLSKVIGLAKRRRVAHHRTAVITSSMAADWIKGAYVYQAIIDTAAAKACDLISMASHGRRGLTAMVLGSETLKVLTHSKLPVLVHR